MTFREMASKICSILEDAEVLMVYKIFLTSTWFRESFQREDVPVLPLNLHYVVNVFKIWKHLQYMAPTLRLDNSKLMDAFYFLEGYNLFLHAHTRTSKTKNWLNCQKTEKCRTLLVPVAIPASPVPCSSCLIDDWITICPPAVLKNEGVVPQSQPQQPPPSDHRDS